MGTTTVKSYFIHTSHAMFFSVGNINKICLFVCVYIYIYRNVTLFLDESDFIILHSDKWFSLFLLETNSSICAKLNGFKY